MNGWNGGGAFRRLIGTRRSYFRFSVYLTIKTVFINVNNVLKTKRKPLMALEAISYHGIFCPNRNADAKMRSDKNYTNCTLKLIANRHAK